MTPRQNGRDKPRAILFDIGMTMVMPSGVYLAGLINKVVEGESVSPDQALRALALASESHHYRSDNSAGNADIVGARLAEVLSLPTEPVTRAWKEASSSGDLYSVLEPSAVDVLDSIRESGFLIGAVSNSDNCVHEELADWKIDRYFDVIVGSCQGLAEKPQTEMFDHALSELEVSPTDAWYVGDGLINDVLGAAKAGIQEQVLVDPYEIYAKPPCLSIRYLSELLELL